ncbi:MAG: COX15/CtaA family protein [Chloroflexota bacterium]
MSAFTKYAWSVVAYTVAVILGGAAVRATGSGAGCGRHWPTCNGEAIPTIEEMATVIEFSHRMMSTLAGFLVIILLVWAYRAYERGSLVRRAALLSFIFIVIEGLLGAGLVLLELVEDNASVWRAIAVSGHLLNTFVLLGWMVLTAWASDQPKTKRGDIPFTFGRAAQIMTVGMVGLAVLSAAGAITALGDTLFLSGSLARTVGEENAAEHFLVQLRIIHPIMGIVVALLLGGLAVWLANAQTSPYVKRLCYTMVGLLVFQTALGMFTIMLRAPLPLQLGHLLTADVMWIVGLLLTFEIMHHAPQTNTSPALQTAQTA